jgi:hypothetical protein
VTEKTCERDGGRVQTVILLPVSLFRSVVLYNTISLVAWPTGCKESGLFRPVAELAMLLKALSKYVYIGSHHHYCSMCNQFKAVVHNLFWFTD